MIIAALGQRTKRRLSPACAVSLPLALSAAAIGAAITAHRYKQIRRRLPKLENTARRRHGELLHTVPFSNGAGAFLASLVVDRAAYA